MTIITLLTATFPVLMFPFLILLLCDKKYWQKNFAIAWGCEFSVLGYYFSPKNVVDFTRYTYVLPYYGKNSLLYLWQNDREMLYLRDLIFHLVGRTEDYNLLSFVVALIVYSIFFYVFFDSVHNYSMDVCESILILLLSIGAVYPFYVLNNVRNITSFVIFGFACYRDIIENKHNLLTYLLYILPIFLHLSAVVLFFIRVLAPIAKKFPVSVVVFSTAIGALVKLLYNVSVSLPYIPFLSTVITKAYQVFFLNNESDKLNFETSDLFYRYFGMILLGIVILLILFSNYENLRQGKKSLLENKMISFIYLSAVIGISSLMINSGAFIRFEAIVSFFLPIIMFPVMSRDRLEYRIPKMMANILSLMAIPLTVINVFLYIRFVDFRISFYDVLITSPIRLLSKMLF